MRVDEIVRGRFAVVDVGFHVDVDVVSRAGCGGQVINIGLDDFTGTPISAVEDPGAGLRVERVDSALAPQLPLVDKFAIKKDATVLVAEFGAVFDVVHAVTGLDDAEASDGGAVGAGESPRREDVVRWDEQCRQKELSPARGCQSRDTSSEEDLR